MGVHLDTGYSDSRVAPFFGPFCKVFENSPTVSEALHLAGLDFEVGKRPAHQQMNDGSYQEIPGKFVTYRTDTELPFGVVGNVYHPFQNEPALALCDELLGHDARIASAGTYNGGCDTFITAQLQNGIHIPGEEDLDLYLLFRNNHGGTGSVSAYITPIRLMCTNQLGSALRQAVSSWKVRHTATVADRIQEATAALKLVDAYKVEMEETVKFLQETEVTVDELDGFLKELTEAKRVQESIRETYNNSPTVTQGNRWGLYNSVTEAIQWNSPRQTSPETQFASGIDGPQARTRDRAMRLLTR